MENQLDKATEASTEDDGSKIRDEVLVTGENQPDILAVPPQSTAPEWLPELGISSDSQLEGVDALIANPNSGRWYYDRNNFPAHKDNSSLYGLPQKWTIEPGAIDEAERYPWDLKDEKPQKFHYQPPTVMEQLDDLRTLDLPFSDGESSVKLKRRCGNFKSSICLELKFNLN